MPRDRITATVVTVLLHVLVFAALLWQAGSRPETRSARGVASGDGLETRVAIAFMARRQPVAPKPPLPVVVETAPQPTPAEQPPVPDAEESAVANARDASNASATRQGSTDAPEDDLDARYLSAVRAAILRQWQAHGGGDIPAGCEVVIDQVDGGKAIRTWVMECGALPVLDRARLETAVMQVQPLPYEGFEPVFRKHLRLTF